MDFGHQGEDHHKVFRKEFLNKQISSSMICTAENDLVLSSDRGQSSVHRYKVNWSSSDTTTHIDMALDHLFEESVQEKQRRLDLVLLPQNTFSENESVQHVYHAEVEKVTQREACTSDLKPSVRKKNCIKIRSTCVNDGLAVEHHSDKPPHSAATRTDNSEISIVGTGTFSDSADCTYIRHDQNGLSHQGQDLTFSKANDDYVKTSAISATDLQPSYRSKTPSSRLLKRNEDASLLTTEHFSKELTALESVSEDQGINTRKCCKELDTNTAGKSDHKSAVSEKDKGHEFTGNVYNEYDSLERTNRERKRSKSMRRHRIRKQCDKKTEEIDGKEKLNKSISNKRRFSKSLEETGYHDNNSNKLQQLLLKRDKVENKSEEQFLSNVQLNMELGQVSSNLIDKGHVHVSQENVLECHREKGSNPECDENPHDFFESRTKRIRYKSGPDISNQDKSVSLNCRQSFVNKKKRFDFKNQFSIKTSKTKSRINGRSKSKRQKHVDRHTDEQGIIHKIHKTIAESGSLGIEVPACKSKENNESEAVRIAELENMIPLDVPSCENVGKRKARLRLEKAKGALYRQVSSGGIWRAVNSKY